MTTDKLEALERAARAMALADKWDGWDTATTCQHTLSGNDPDEEREHYRDLARAALAAIRAEMGGVTVDKAMVVRACDGFGALKMDARVYEARMEAALTAALNPTTGEGNG